MELKKNHNIDYNRHRTLLLAVGLFISTFLVSMIFKIRSSYEPITFQDPPEVFESYMPPIPITEFDKPQEPVKPQPQLPNRVVLTDLPKVELTKILERAPEPFEHIGETAPPIHDPPIENSPTTFLVVEEQASFPGGTEAWLKYLRKNFKYPKRAKRSGVEGRVFLNFYVDAEGNLSDIKVIRGIGSGCDQEAIRVLKNSPQWNSGRQRGKAVKSPMTIFIIFRLK